MKLKYLNYLPKPIHIDESRYDLVDDDEFFKRTYLTNNEQDGLVILYANEELTKGLIEDQTTFVSYINQVVKGK